MGLYGNKFLDTGYFNISISEFFDHLDQQEILFEDTFALATVDQKDKINTDSIEETKKKLLDIIKNIFNKVVTFIQDIIKGFIKFIEFIEEKINRDEIVKKFGKGVTWDAIQNAMNNGWEGIPTDLPYADISQDQLIQNMDVFTIIAGEITANKEFDLEVLKKDIEKIKDMKSITDARSAYNDHVNTINQIRPDIMKLSQQYQVDKKVYISRDQKNGKYKITQQIFHMIENSSINSRSIIKNIKEQGKKVTDRIESEQIKPLKREIENNLKATGDNAEFLKIENYYLKTKLAYNNLILQNTLNGINVIVKETKNKISINTRVYLYIASHISKYNKKDNKESEGNDK